MKHPAAQEKEVKQMKKYKFLIRICFADRSAGVVYPIYGEVNGFVSEGLTRQERRLCDLRAAARVAAR